MASRETGNNAYAEFCRGKESIMVFLILANKIICFDVTIVQDAKCQEKSGLIEITEDQRISVSRFWWSEGKRGQNKEARKSKKGREDWRE